MSGGSISHPQLISRHRPCWMPWLCRSEPLWRVLGRGFALPRELARVRPFRRTQRTLAAIAIRCGRSPRRAPEGIGGSPRRGCACTGTSCRAPFARGTRRLERRQVPDVSLDFGCLDPKGLEGPERHRLALSAEEAVANIGYTASISKTAMSGRISFFTNNFSLKIFEAGPII